MSPNDLLTVLFVFIAANIALIVAALIMSRVRRRRGVASVPLDHAATAGPKGNAVATAPSAVRGGDLSTAMLQPEPGERATDPLTGQLSANDWSRLVSDEDVRIRRYRRPATIALVELDGLDRLVSALGQQAADRVLAAVADTLHRHARKADHIARLGPSRFGILLPETDEVSAINYIERVRRASDLWLESGAIALRLAIGWASPMVESTLADAQAQALERMFAEVHRGTLRDSRGDPVPSARTPDIKGAPSAA